jgi:hypothetical protein
MSLHQWFGVLGLAALGALIGFSFWRGDKVKPSGRDPDGQTIAGDKSTDSHGPL